MNAVRTIAEDFSNVYGKEPGSVMPLNILHSKSKRLQEWIPVSAGREAQANTAFIMLCFLTRKKKLACMPPTARCGLQRHWWKVMSTILLPTFSACVRSGKMNGWDLQQEVSSKKPSKEKFRGYG